MNQILQQPVIQVALPIVMTLVVASAINNKRLDDICRRLDRVEDRLDLLIGKVAELDNRVTRIEDKLGIAPR